MLSGQIISKIKKIVGDKNLKTGNFADTIDPGVSEQNLQADVIVSPQTEQQLSQIVRLCHEHTIQIVPHGGRTGLSGAAESKPGQLIIQTTKLNKIIEIDTVGGIAIVESGVTLQQLQDALAALDYSIGIDLAARGSATIGGMVSTNAGGNQAFRNGITRHQVLGLRAVLPNGEIFSDLKQVIKANEGYDIKQLLIGAEGTLGIVTRIVLRLLPAQGHRQTALISCDNALAAVKAFQILRRIRDCRLLNAEIMWPDYARTTAQALGLSRILDFTDSKSDVFVIVDISCITDDAGVQRLEEILAELLGEGLINNALIAQNQRESHQIWTIREETFLCDKMYPNGFWYDVSLPLSHLHSYSEKLFKKIKSLDKDFRVFLFGHLGDGNLHITISSGQSCPELGPAVNRAVYDGLCEIGGSFSAEHGIGREKISALAQYTDSNKLALMRAIKSIIDPKGIFNPGKVISDEI